MSRPFILDPLFASVKTLAGVGPKVAAAMEKLAGPKLIDLLWHTPIDVIDRRYSPKVGEIAAPGIVTLEITIGKHSAPPRRSQPYRIEAYDATGRMDLVFFHANKDWLEKQLPEGQKRIVSGRVEKYRDKYQMVHPDHMGPLEDKDKITSLDPIYPMTQGLAPKTLRKAIKSTLDRVPDLPEWLDAAHAKQNNWPEWKNALQTLHNPEKPDDLAPNSPARERLAYDELLAGQLAISLVRSRDKQAKGISFTASTNLRDKIYAALPFELTPAQKGALAEIDVDMSSPQRMLRLLQGDVGSGKTIVALLAMLNAVENGYQAAIMAPTEILARQHAESIAPLAAKAGLKTIILTGRDKGKSRESLLGDIASGNAQIVIGTHALFQDEVVFRNLGLAIIDEQHRFGVHQRLLLSQKGADTDVLVMTATPIPRTLVLTSYGDMDVSKITGKPPGRKPIDTRSIAQDRIEDLIAGLKRKTAEGDRVYWVCPIIEESESLDVAAAEERYGILKQHFGDRVGLLHGRMKSDEKDAIMKAFATGNLDILVATTVIEVGVNVPEATVMVIDHAERFGLAQLHQLRGRVGRGDKASSCILLYAAPLSSTAKSRLGIMRETEDGFRISEEDLRLRGGGEILGTRQSGEAGFKLADMAVHGELLYAAHDDARLIVEKDPYLQSERGQALRILLYLLERDHAIQFLRSG